MSLLPYKLAEGLHFSAFHCFPEAQEMGYKELSRRMLLRASAVEISLVE